MTWLLLRAVVVDVVEGVVGEDPRPLVIGVVVVVLLELDVLVLPGVKEIGIASKGPTQRDESKMGRKYLDIILVGFSSRNSNSENCRNDCFGCPIPSP